MKFFIAASVFCVVAFSLTAKGCELPPPEVSLYQAECGKQLPPHFENCVLVPTDCGCTTMECTASGSTEKRSFSLTQESSGVWTCVDDEIYYLAVIDESTQQVTVHNCVRSATTGVITVFALDDSGNLCETSLDSYGSVVYTPVIKRSVSYAPANGVELTSVEYDEHVATCSLPLPAPLDVSSYKRVVQNDQGDVLMDCIAADEHFHFALILSQDTGLYTCESLGDYFAVFIDKSLSITVQRIVSNTYNERSVVYSLDSENNLCDTWYNVDTDLVEFTPITRSGGEVPYGCED